MPTPSPERVAPLLWEGPLSMNHLAPAGNDVGGGEGDGQGSGLLGQDVGAGFHGEGVVGDNDGFRRGCIPPEGGG